GVRQPGRRARLALETLERVAVAQPAADEHLDRHRAGQAQIGGPVDRAHPAPTDASLEPILVVDGARHRQAELQARAVLGARLRPGVVAPAAARALRHRVEARDGLARHAPLLGDALTQGARLEHRAHLRRDRAEQAPVAVAPALSRALLAE